MKMILKYVGFVFLMIGAFLMEWSFRGFKSACREMGMYYKTRHCSYDEETW